MTNAFTFARNIRDFLTSAPSNSAASVAGTSSNAAINNHLFQDAAREQMDYQTQSAERAMQFNSEEAEKARNWSEMMSNTGYQRSVQDLKAAGLNPILAYTNGPASTPGSTSATGVSQPGAMANVDTQDWESMQKQAKAAMLSAAAEMTSASARAAEQVRKSFNANPFD